jgi:hypothetical protein
MGRALKSVVRSSTTTKSRTNDIVNVVAAGLRNVRRDHVGHHDIVHVVKGGADRAAFGVVACKFAQAIEEAFEALVAGFPDQCVERHQTGDDAGGISGHLAVKAIAGTL